jgi:hypothetical protein
MSLINDYFITIEVRQHHAELIAEAETDRLARLGRQARKAAKKLRRQVLGAQRPAPVEPDYAATPTVRTTEPAEVRPAAEPAESDREPVDACRVNSI